MTGSVTNRGLSLRTALLLIGLGALVYVGMMAVAIAWQVVPAAEDVQRRGRIAITDYERRTQIASRLDDVMTDLWRLLRVSRTGRPPMAALQQRRQEVEALVESSGTLMSRAAVPSPELRSLLGAADRATIGLSGVMLGAIASMELADVPNAERLLQRADSLDTPLNSALTAITTTTLRDVNVAEATLASHARTLSIMVAVWLVVGALMLPLLALFLRKRLYAPLASVERGLTRIERGDLEVALPVRRDDEMGRLEAQINRMTSILRQRRLDDEQRALSRTEARTRAIFDSALDAVVVFDADALIQEWSPQAETTFGWTREQVLGRALAPTIFPDAERERAMSELLRARSTGSDGAEHHRLELPAKRKDGTPLIVEVSLAVLESEEATEFGAFLRDVTDQKRRSDELRQAQKMEAVGQLAGGVAHDFNNLLTAIIGYAELLQHDESASADIRDDAASIRATALRGADLAQSLLTLARRSPHREEPVDAHAIVHEVAELVRRTFDRRIDVRTELRATTAAVIGDHSLLSNALLNLALNARDAMPDGGTLAFRTRVQVLDQEFLLHRQATGEAGEYLIIEVTDTGVGMSSETKARVFEPFFTTKEVGKGTGLGLASVYGTVKAHNGAIDVDSVPGHGTKFTLALPVHREEDVALANTVSKPLPGKGLILLVDDEEVLRNVALRMLQRLGYDVECAADGAAAVARLASDNHGVDVVLLDGNMPRMSGMEAARIIHARHPSLPLVFASGYFDPRVNERPSEWGFREVIVKPYTLDQLSRAVARCLGLRSGGTPMSSPAIT